MRAGSGLRDLFARAATRAGVEDPRLHDIRAKARKDAKRQRLDAQRLAAQATESIPARHIRDRATEVVTGPSSRQNQLNIHH